MAATKEQDSEEEEEQVTQDTTFVWDEKSQLYYHASTGFYHDPIGGWYYSSKDGLYYKFENGNYVLLESDQCQDHNSEKLSESITANNFVEDEQYNNVQRDEIGESEAEIVGPILHESTSDQSVSVNNQLPEDLHPPSEWLEDTLIELYLSGYSNQAASGTSEETMPAQPNDLNHLADGAGDTDELEEGEWIPDDKHYSVNLSGNALDEGAMSDEERWRSQYGQVTHQNEESTSSVRLVDLWDWTVVKKCRKHGKGEVTRLVGRLVKRSMKLHPSVPTGGGLFKTAPVCEVHLDLVRVTSGQIYRLRTPSSQYLASTSTYDSSDPTKDWAFPPLSISDHIQPPLMIGGECESNHTKELSFNQDRSLPTEQLVEMKRSHIYRDRAAERRALHGGFGVGPGQKKSQNDVDSAPSSPTSNCPEQAAAESLSLSFGEGSYARRMLKSMGWKEGEALGSSNKGLIEPLQAIGNKGNAGLGWNIHTRK